jgi:hypothetical protein
MPFPPKRRHARLVEMLAVKTGDRVAQLGRTDPELLAAIGHKLGPSGCIVAMVPDQPSADLMRGEGAAGDIRVEVVSLTNLLQPAATYDLVLVDETHGLFESVRPERRRSVVGEVFRVLRPGGTVIVIGRQPRGGMLGALLATVSPLSLSDLKEWLAAEGFVSVRLLAAHGELALAEGVKPSS